VDVNQEKVKAAIRIQARLRGWMVRRHLALAGPGVLTRGTLANDEDLETCEEASRQSPLDYVAFSEAGKIWWFDFATLWKWVQLSVEPVNPYTKVPLTVETKQRLRRLWSLRRHHRYPVPTESSVYQDRLRVRWTLVCQIFADNGFGVMNPEPFLELTKNDYIVILRRLRDSVQASISPHHSAQALVLIHRCLISAWTLPPTQFSLQCSYALMAMLLHAKVEFPLAFCILSSLYDL
jgi:hypothetical protein